MTSTPDRDRSRAEKEDLLRRRLRWLRHRTEVLQEERRAATEELARVRGEIAALARARRRAREGSA